MQVLDAPERVDDLLEDGFDLVVAALLVVDVVALRPLS
jgi:hypothetical protein